MLPLKKRALPQAILEETARPRQLKATQPHQIAPNHQPTAINDYHYTLNTRFFRERGPTNPPFPSLFGPPPTVQHNQDNEGWQQVRRRRRKTAAPRRGQMGQFRNTKSLPKIFQQAIKANLCFRCLGKGHRRIQCRDSLKCLKCGKSGHLMKLCTYVFKEKAPQPIPNPAFLRPNVSYAQVAAVKPSTALAPSPSHLSPPVMAEYDDDFIDTRPHHQDIFFPPFEGHTDQTRYLDNTGVVFFLNGRPRAELKPIIAETLANRNGGEMTAYQVHNADVAGLIVTCPSARALDRAVWNSPYTLNHQRVRFGIIKWDQLTGLQMDPPTTQLWIALRGLPLHAWTHDGISRAVSGFGTPTWILPFAQENNQYDEIYLQVEGKHPSLIPLQARFNQGGRATYVHVYIHKWRAIRQTPFPPPPYFPPRRGRYEGPPRYDEGSSASNLPEDLSSQNGSASPSWPAPPQNNNQGRNRRNRSGKVHQQWVPKKFQTFACTKIIRSATEDPMEFLAAQGTVTVSNGSSITFFKVYEAYSMPIIQLSMTPAIPVRFSNCFTFLVSVESLRENTLTITATHLGNNGRANVNQTIRTKPGHKEGPLEPDNSAPDWAMPEESSLIGLSVDQAQVQAQFSPNSNDQIPAEADEDHGPHSGQNRDMEHPPGFPFPIYSSPPTPRRSPRLQAKLDGPYISTMQRAQALKENIRPKSAPMRGAPPPPLRQIDFSNQKDPLSLVKTLEIIVAAGSHLSQELYTAILEAVTVNEPLRLAYDV